MDEKTKKYKNVRQLSQYYFTITKKWWTAAWWLKIATFVFGLGVVFFPDISVWVTLLVGTLSFASETCNVCSSNEKATAETLLRNLDLQDSFGWEIQDIEIADAFVSLPTKVQHQLSYTEHPDDYFASSKSSGWNRAMQNLQESAWWSKHLSRCMGRYTFVLTIILVVISVVTLLISSFLIPVASQLTSINRIVISILLLIVSLGLIPLTIGYFNFSIRAGDAQQRASDLLKSDSDNTIQAIKVFNEYHLARATAPLVPTWLWKRKNISLNRAWRVFVAK